MCAAAALTTGSYACFLAAETALPFLYMPDCLASTYQLMMADPAVLQQARFPRAGAHAIVLVMGHSLEEVTACLTQC